MALLEGVKINMGGRDFIVPPLNFAALRRLGPELAIAETVTSAPTLQELEAVVKLVHAALVRNYPEITLAEVEELLDMGNTISVLRAITGAVEDDPGKAPAATAANP